jgi:hypothetical protein
MKLTKLFLIFTLLISFSHFANGQKPQKQTQTKNFEIKGIVTDSISGKELPFATISVQSAQNGVIKRLATDTNGKFNFTINTAGKYSIIIQSVGYETKTREIDLTSEKNKIDLGEIKISEGVQKIEEVSVVAQKPLVRKEVDKIVYSAEVDPEAKTSNALEMLRKVPLVTVDGQDNIQIKGSSNFKILINGKSSTIANQNPKEFLRSLPSSSIKDIEVITNPSSKYEAEGTAGILNIITNKKRLDGFMVRVNTGADSRGGYNSGVYATSKINKFGFSLNYNLYHFRQPQNESHSSYENFQSTTNHYNQTDGSNKYTGSSNMLTGEASYEIDSLNLVSLSLWGYAGNYTSHGELNSKDLDVSNTISRQFLNKVSANMDYGSFSGNIDYQRTFKKPDKTFTISYKFERMPQNTDNENEVDAILNYSDYKQHSTNKASDTEHTFQIDYYDPLTKKHQIECGLKYILRMNVSNTDISRYNYTTATWYNDETGLNDMDYNQHIIGAYVGYVLKLSKISIKSGLRGEGTINDGEYKSTDSISFNNKMFNLIPYLTLSRNMNKGQSMTLAYTQRLSRPGIWYLNPYVNDTDPLNISYGNPKLDAEISHTFDFSYGKFSEKYNFNLSLNSSFTNNAIESVSTMQSSGVKTTTYENIGKEQRYGGYLFGSIKLFKQKLNINTNLGTNYSIMESNDDRNLKNQGFNFNGSLSVRYSTWKNGTVSGYGGYYSRDLTLQGKSSSYSYHGLSISQELFKKKFSISASVSNPFKKTYKYTYTYNDQTFSQTNTTYANNRQFRIYISYTFGQMNSEIKKARRGIRNEDVKSGGNSNGGSGGKGN